jgi:hypothetical protein
MRIIQKYWQWLLLLSLALRILHFGPALDAPHTWRQSDTGQYIRDFYENGIDLLHPTVCWMGGYGTLILEFPLPEAVVAVAYHILGEDHRVARLVFLLFFLISAIYLRKFLKLFLRDGIPELATVLYSFAPLSVFYSRAVHIDFAALAMAHIMFFYLLRGVLNTSGKDMIVGALWASLAFLIKAPYAFYFALPLIVFIHQKKQWRFALRHVYLVLIPVSVFCVWRWHVRGVNTLAPDWGFLLGYNNFSDMGYLYFGFWEQRFDPELWDNVFKRIQLEIVGGLGTFLLLIGIVKSWFSPSGRILLVWGLGTMIYLFIFFNLNVQHNYYQIPFIAPALTMVAIGALTAVRTFRKYETGLLAAWLIIFSVGSYRISESRYFRQPVVQQAISSLVEATSDKGDLVVISSIYSSSQFPCHLYGAHRQGWSYPFLLQNPTVLYRLKDEGASAAYLVTEEKLLLGELGRMYDQTPGSETFQLSGQGLSIFKIPL